MIGLADFTGRWSVDRWIEDRRAGQGARFSGTATLAPDPNGLLYTETGTLHLPGQEPIHAIRRYLWRAAAQGAIAIHFEDGRPFHAFRPEGRPRAAHDCGPDTYRVAYDFTRWPDWSATWEVSGPRKDYTARTRYSPCGQRDAGAQHEPDTRELTEKTP